MRGHSQSDSFDIQLWSVKSTPFERCDAHGTNFIKHQFPKIEVAYFKDCEFIYEEIIHFIASNSTLTKLSIVFCHIESQQIFRYIAQFLPRLHDLKIQQVYEETDAFQTDILNVANLKLLTKLELHFNSTDIFQLIFKLSFK